MNRPILIISACLAGLRTRYDGSARPHPSLSFLSKNAILVPACPEILGGLGIPRIACRFYGGDGYSVLNGEARIVNKNGVDMTSAFIRGAEEMLNIAAIVEPKLIIFKESSPSCGVKRVDIEGIKQSGVGVATAMLKSNGFYIISEEDSLPELHEMP